MCLGILSQDQWDPSSFSMEHVLQAIVAILIRPEESNALDHDTLNNYHNYTSTYNARAKASAAASRKENS